MVVNEIAFPCQSSVTYRLPFFWFFEMKTQKKIVKSKGIQPTPNLSNTFKKKGDVLRRSDSSSGLASKSNKMSSWRYERSNFTSAASTTVVIEKLSESLQAGATIGSHIAVGFNSVMKAMESGNARIVCISKDMPPALSGYLIEAASICSARLVERCESIDDRADRRSCNIQREPGHLSCIVFAKLSQALCEVLHLKSTSCFAVLRPSIVEGCVEENTSSSSIAAPDGSVLESLNNTGDCASFGDKRDNACEGDNQNSTNCQQLKNQHLDAKLDALCDYLQSLVREIDPHPGKEYSSLL